MLKDQFWFLYILFFVSVAFAVIQYYGKANCTLQLLIGIVLNYISQFLSFTPLEVFCYYYFFFVLGDFVSKALLNHYQKIGSVWVIAGLIPVFLLSQWYWISHPQLKEEFLLLFNLVAILGSAFILSMSVRLGDLQKLNWLKTVGKHSLYIYVMHVIVQAGIRELLVDIAKIETLTYLLFITVSASLILPIFTYRHSMKLNLWYLYSIENFKITKRKLTGTV
jgi:peptidoglycan/LPS O-acetylase OafA/YrhL